MIRVNEDYVIDVDQYNYTAKIDLHKKYSSKKDGEVDAYKTIGYYSNLRQAVKGIVTYQVRNVLSDGNYTLSQAVQEVERAYNEIDRIINQISDENINA